VPEKALDAMRVQFAAGTTDEGATAGTIADAWARSGYLADPHTAVGLSVARKLKTHEAAMITLSTAHPAKFPAAVKAASSVDPALPEWLADLHEREERVTVLNNDQDAVEAFVRAHSRAGEV
jgi:threonine synthase